MKNKEYATPRPKPQASNGDSSWPPRWGKDPDNLDEDDQHFADKILSLLATQRSETTPNYLKEDPIWKALSDQIKQFREDLSRK